MGALAQIGAELGIGVGDRLVIDLPVVDFTDAQLVDLAEELGAPLQAFWPCNGAADRPCGRCEGCRRWSAAFREVGVPWPWAERGAPVATRVV